MCWRIDFMTTRMWLSGYNNILIAGVQAMLKENVNIMFSEHPALWS